MKMQPWTVDADDIQMADDYDERLLHRTPDVDKFLDPHGARCFVIGTKGLGKTLLLKAKRVDLQSRMKCLPRNALIDKPVGDRIFSAGMLQLFSRTSDNWRKVWLISIAAAVLKALDRAEGVATTPRLRALLRAPGLVTVMDHFVNILDWPPGDLFQAANDADTHLVPALRGVDTPIALFIDSVDEYFNRHILDVNAVEAGELSPGVWRFSQMGLVEVVYQLRRVSRHVKIFASVRKEAFERFGDGDPMVQQYRGSTVDMEYDAASLREILLSNIRRESPANLVDEKQLGDAPLTAFLGHSKLHHAHTGKEEDVFEYIYRHTLGRPRDLMTVGSWLSRTPPPARTANAVKTAVNSAATEIAKEYLNEIAPWTKDVDLGLLWRLLPGSVLSAESAERVSDEYRKCRDGSPGATADRDPLALLYFSGLVGVVEQDHVTGSSIQRFLRPGAKSLHEQVRLAPSSHYILHPALAEVVSTVNPRFLRAVHKEHVVGDEQVWQDAPRARVLCVLVADIVKFSRIMRSGDDVSVRECLAEAVRTHAGEFVVAKVEGGDRLTVVCEEPAQIIKAARRIMEDLYAAPHQPVLRVGVARGEVEVAPDGDAALRGEPLRIAARLERIVELSDGEPGAIWVTEDVKGALAADGAFYRVESLGLRDLSKPDEATEEALVYRVS